MESPDSSWLPEALDLPWPPKLPASVLETICALSASCVSVSSRSQSLPGVPDPPWRAPAPVSSAPPWWAPVSSAPPWWAPVSSAPPCQSHLMSPPTCQSHLTSPPTCQSHLTSPPTCQSHLTSPPTCQSHLTSLLSRPLHPGGLLSHLPHMDLALRSLPRFHLRSTTLLDCSMCEASGSHSLGGGALSWIWLPLHHMDSYTTLQLHITPPQTTTPIIHCTYDTHIPIHHCTNHTAVTNHSLALIVPPHLHLIHTHTYKQHTSMHSPWSLVLAPADISERYPSCCLLSLCLTPDCPTLELWTCACDPDFCLVLFTSLPCLWYSCFCPLTFACLILPLSNKYLTAHGSTRLWPVITTAVRW